MSGTRVKKFSEVLSNLDPQVVSVDGLFSRWCGLFGYKVENGAFPLSVLRSRFADDLTEYFISSEIQSDALVESTGQIRVYRKGGVPKKPQSALIREHEEALETLLKDLRSTECGRV